MKGDFHVRFCENLRVKLPWVTRLCAIFMTDYYIINNEPNETLFLFYSPIFYKCFIWTR